MDATEQIVRLRLSQKTNKEFLEYASRHPEIKEKLDRAIQEYKNGFIDSITSIIPLESEELERFKGSFGPYMDKISEMFSYEKMIENRGRAYFESYDAFREKFERLYDELKNNKEVASIVNLLTIRDAVNELLYHPSFIDTLIARLAEKARKTTIDQALTDDSLYAATREIFPTEQSYREYFESSYNIGKRTLNQLGNIFDFSKLLRAKSREEKAALEGINKAIGSLLTGIEPIIDIWLKIEKERRDEEIKKIYT